MDKLPGALRASYFIAGALFIIYPVLFQFYYVSTPYALFTFQQYP